MTDRKIRNMEEFAAVSGISRPTVSKYFNDPGSVRHTTRERIEAALEQWNYRPNIYAVNQNRRSTRNVGIVVPFIADPFFAEISRNIEQLCIDAGYRPILMSSHNGAAHEVENLDALRSLKPAGVLLAPLGRSSNRDAVESFCSDVPTVLFDSNIDHVGAAFIGSNNAQSIKLIVDYLCRSGEAPSFFEMKSPTNPNAFKRRQAYERAMTQNGLEPMFVQVDGKGWDFEDIGYREGGAVLDRRALQTNTVLCSNDRLAIGFLAAAYERGLRVGHGTGCSLRIAGHDDHPFARYTCPKLTTVAQNYTAIARRSVELLVRLLDGHESLDADVVTLFDGTLIMRESA